MGETTGIQWCDHTFNPWLGCTKVAPECKHCYAETWGKRFGVEWGDRGERRRTSAANWRKPSKWNVDAIQAGERRRVFVASLADVFEDRPELEPWREALWSLIDKCRGLDWLLLTKRPENIRSMVHWGPWGDSYSWPHVWLGTSAGTQATADQNVPHLLRAPAAVRFVSAEPLLGAVDLSDYLHGYCPACRTLGDFAHSGTCVVRRIDWVIAGAESGPGARPMDEEWARELRAQCEEHCRAFFYKQKLTADGQKVGLPLLDGRQWMQFPHIMRCTSGSGRTTNGSQL